MLLILKTQFQLSNSGAQVCTDNGGKKIYSGYIASSPNTDTSASDLISDTDNSDTIATVLVSDTPSGGVSGSCLDI